MIAGRDDFRSDLRRSRPRWRCETREQWEEIISDGSARALTRQRDVNFQRSRNISFGAGAVGAVALGVAAVGVLAIGKLVINELSLHRAKLRSAQVDELRIGRLTIGELRVENSPKTGH